MQLNPRRTEIILWSVIILTFIDFFSSSRANKKYQIDPVAMHIFECIISKEANILKMIKAIKAGNPALMGCVKEIENYFDSIKRIPALFDLNDNSCKQIIGKMVAYVLKEYGFKPDKEIPISSNYFKNAHKYK